VTRYFVLYSPRYNVSLVCFYRWYRISLLFSPIKTLAAVVEQKQVSE